MVNTRAVCVSVAILFGVALSACSSAPKPKEVELIIGGETVNSDTVMYKEYSNEEKKVQFRYPAEWTIEDKSTEGQFAVLFMSPEQYQFEDNRYPAASILFIANTTTDSRKVVFGRFMANPTSLTEIPLQGKRGKTKLGGEEAIEEKTLGLADGAKVKGGSVLTVQNGFAYVVNYASMEEKFKAYEPMFNEVLKSVEFKK